MRFVVERTNASIKPNILEGIAKKKLKEREGN
jgi:hypothetical protein